MYRATLIAAVALLALPGAAAAETLVRTSYGGSGRGDDSIIVYVRAGEGANHVEVTFRNNTFQVSDSGDSIAVKGRCERLGKHRASCPNPELDYPNSLVVTAGRGSDHVEIGESVPAKIGTRIEGARGADTLLGGIGGDQFYGGRGPDHIDGRGGDDTLSGDRGANTLLGGDGNDLISAHYPVQRDKLIDCGAGDGDYAEIDRFDPEPLNCEDVHGGR